MSFLQKSDAGGAGAGRVGTRGDDMPKGHIPITNPLQIQTWNWFLNKNVGEAHTII